MLCEPQHACAGTHGLRLPKPKQPTKNGTRKSTFITRLHQPKHTIEGAALVALVWLLYHHDVDGSRKVRRDGIHTTQEGAPAVENRALQSKEAVRESSQLDREPYVCPVAERSSQMRSLCPKTTMSRTLQQHLLQAAML